MNERVRTAIVYIDLIETGSEAHNLWMGRITCYYWPGFKSNTISVIGVPSTLSLSAKGSGERWFSVLGEWNLAPFG